MSDLFAKLKHMLLAPFQNEEQSWEAARHRSMLLGLPAIVATLLAIVMLGMTQIGQQGRLESRYAGLLSASQKAFDSKETALSSQKNLAVQRAEETGEDPKTRIAELQKDIQLHREEVQIYLAKLMDLDPENLDYAYQLAMAYRESDPEKHQALMNKLAPETEPVYFKAHKYMAQTYYRQSTEATSYAEKQMLLEKALIQTKHTLVQQANDVSARSIKARILFEKEDYQGAQEIYRELFAQIPDFYNPLIAVFEKTNTDNSVTLKTAIDAYDELRKKNTKNEIKVWVKCWQNLVRCWILLEDYEVARDNLMREYKFQKSENVRRKFLQNQLARVYTSWANQDLDFVNMDLASRTEALNRLKEAYKNNPKDPGALTLLAKFVANDPDLGDQAKEIYDPYRDQSPPSDVLTELGSRSLKINDYPRAISLFKRARSRDPRNPLILNNLAYAHLVSQNSQKSAAEALTLIEEGIRMIATAPPNQRQRISNLFHTRGTALMQLGRLEDAIASFESALRDRPENLDIVRALVVCYEGRIDAQAEMYREYQAKLEAMAKLKAKARKTEDLN